MLTPELAPRPMVLKLDYANKLLGLNLTVAEASKLLKKMRYDARPSGKDLKVDIPSYRTDVLHPMDLVEDIAIAYGYQNFKPQMFKKFTLPKRDPLVEYSQKVRKTMLGFGFQEVMTLIMTDKNRLFERMCISEEKVVEAGNPVSSEHSVARSWLLPSLLSVLENNRNMEYPQNLFEVGDCVTSTGKTNRKLCAVTAHSASNFSQMKATYLGLVHTLGVDVKVKALKHNSFIDGRCCESSFGFFGELHPTVLENFGMEIPVTAIELDLDQTFSNLGK